MTPVAGNPSAPNPETALTTNVQRAVQLTFDVLEMLLNARYSASRIGVDSARQMVPQASVLKSGVDLIGRVVDREFALERDLLARVRKAVNPNSVSVSVSVAPQSQPAGEAPSPALADNPAQHRHSSGSQPASQAPSPAPEQALRLVTHQGSGLLAVPLHLKNHHVSAESITMTATPFWSPGGKGVLSQRITFEPAALEVPGKGTGVTKVVVDVDRDFQAGLDYEADILIQGRNRKRIPLIVSILAAEHPEPDAGSTLPADPGGSGGLAPAVAIIPDAASAPPAATPPGTPRRSAARRVPPGRSPRGSRSPRLSEKVTKPLQ
jgi:hypothetical protein